MEVSSITKRWCLPCVLNAGVEVGVSDELWGNTWDAGKIFAESVHSITEADPSMVAENDDRLFGLLICRAHWGHRHSTGEREDYDFLEESRLPWTWLSAAT